MRGRWIAVFACVGVIGLSAAGTVAATRWAHAYAARTLKSALGGAEVRLGQWSIRRPLAVSLSDIRIHSKLYSVRIPEARLDSVGLLTLDRPEIELKSLDWMGGQRPQPGTNRGIVWSPLRRVRVQDLRLTVAGKGTEIRLTGTVDWSIASRRLEFAEITADSIQSGPFKLRDLRFRGRHDEDGAFSFADLRLLKLRADGGTGKWRLEADGVRLEGVRAAMLRGQIEGGAELRWNQSPPIRMEWTVTEADLDAFTRDLELQNKMSVSGKLVGKISLTADWAGLRSVESSWQATSGGGDIRIMDEALLDRVAAGARQPREIVDAALRDYHFDSGALDCRMEGRDLGLRVRMNGAKGKRDLEIKLHDIL